ncbi:MAG: protein kinase domain-containing protein, partial [Thermoanaerobaculia bacterium]
MAHAAGTRLGPYEILSPLGAGGMGEVYRARDARLERTVAIKVLPSGLAASPEVRQRFEREAKTISQLSHPHICAIYDVGREGEAEYIVMELLEGETLSDRLAKGALPLEQTIRYGVEISDALDKAHRQGIVHRDLKPGNVMITKSGVKLLDFGLAKAFERPLDAEGRGQATVGHHPLARSGLTAIPTVAGSPHLTQEGTILGTFQYMAPEQLEGKEADSRTDIFAFGATLYEMATGKKAFSGASQASLISAIMKEEPAPLSQVEPTTPPAFDRLVKTCLAKDPEDRWRTAHDVMLELKWIAAGGSQATPAVPVAARRKSREGLGWIVAGVLLLFAIGQAFVSSRRAPPESRAIRFSVLPPAKAVVDSISVAPDGSHLAFVASSPDGRILLWVRPLEAQTARPIVGTDGAMFAFWSPDSRFLGFFAEGKLKKVEAAGGPVETLCDAAYPRGGTWNRDGVVLFTPNSGGPVFRVSAAGGLATPLTALDPSRKETSHRWPYFLPDGRHFLYYARSGQPENAGIYVGSLDSKETRRLVSTPSNAAYAPSGYLLFARDGTLMAQAFDVEKLRFTGEPFPAAEDVGFDGGTFRADFAVSENGVLTYRTSASFLARLTWFDRGGKQLGSVGPPGSYFNLSLSLDDRKLAVSRLASWTGTRDIWVYDLSRGTSSRFTFDPSTELSPFWSPDASRIVFSSDRAGPLDLYQRVATGGSDDE